MHSCSLNVVMECCTSVCALRRGLVTEVLLKRVRRMYTSVVSSGSSVEYHDTSPPKNARVVICGGGVMGAAVAYHLAQLGWGPHTVLVELGRCGGGTTWHLSGLVGAFKPTLTQVKLAQSSIQLYKDMEKQGLKTGWKQCGSLCIARTRDRMTVFRRMKAQSVSWNIECELVTPQQAQKLCPLLAVDDLQGGLWIPGDGVGDPYQICQSLISAAKEGGGGLSAPV